VRFGGRVYDDARLDTRSARGLRLALGLQSSSTPNVTLNVALDALRVGRSEPAALFTNGVAVGRVAQPDHLRRALDVNLNYSF
ncbi:MAG: hypothetical protein RLZ81_1095, partial [Pseudomonadota bacterium]